mgnify:CR=1 FL=1
MAKLTFLGQSVETIGSFPKVGDQAPDFKMVDQNLSDISLENFLGNKVILNIVPSIDTDVCAKQLKRFNQELSSLHNVILLLASMDLPFAHKRFCEAEDIRNATTLSDYRYHSLESYGVKLKDAPLNGLYARSVLVLDEQHRILHSEMVSEITNEPDYNAALHAISN